MSHELIADGLVSFLVEAKYKPLFDNAVRKIGNFVYASDEMKREASRYLPALHKLFEATDGRLVMVLKKEPGLILLRDVLDHYPTAGFPADWDRLVGWIQSTLHNLCCYLEYAGLTHNDISPDSYFISPAGHSGALLGGWWFAERVGLRMLGATGRTFKLMPMDVREVKLADPRVDLELVRSVGRELLGDITGMKLLNTRPAPEPMLTWLRHPAGGNAREEYRIWRDEVLTESFGPRRFVETIERCLDPRFRTTVADLLDPRSFEKRMDTIRADYVPKRLKTLGIDSLPEKFASRLADRELSARFIEDAVDFAEEVVISGGEQLRSAGNLVFEGAQGLLLDEFHPWFPHVTRSRTGLVNVTVLAKEAGKRSLDVTYVTRAYLTRHGAGPLPFGLPEKPYEGIEDRTNIHNTFQGSLRFAWLNLDLLASAVKRDLAEGEGLDIRPGLAMTCLDQVEQSLKCVRNGAIEEDLRENVVTRAREMLGFGGCLASMGSSRRTVDAVV